MKHQLHIPKSAPRPVDPLVPVWRFDEFHLQAEEAAALTRHLQAAWGELEPSPLPWPEGDPVEAEGADLRRFLLQSLNAKCNPAFALFHLEAKDGPRLVTAVNLCRPQPGHEDDQPHDNNGDHSRLWADLSRAQPRPVEFPLSPYHSGRAESCHQRAGMTLCAADWADLEKETLQRGLPLEAVLAHSLACVLQSYAAPKPLEMLLLLQGETQALRYLPTMKRDLPWAQAVAEAALACDPFALPSGGDAPPFLFALNAGQPFGLRPGPLRDFTPAHWWLHLPRGYFFAQCTGSAAGLRVECQLEHGLLAPRLFSDLCRSWQEALRHLAQGRGWQTPWQTPLPLYQLDARERANHTAQPDLLPPDERLHGGFLRQVAARPERIALVHPGGSLTYGQLHAHAQALAGQLIRAGVEPGELVGIYAPKSWQQIAMVFGILQAGGAYMPLTPATPPKRLARICRQGEIKRMVTTQVRLADLADLEGVEFLLLPEEADSTPSPPGEFRQGPQDLAYVIYTSGSSGEPKGVMITHQMAGNTIADINLRFQVQEDDVGILLAQLNFDLSVYDIFGILGTGGRLVIPQADMDKNPIHLTQLMLAHRPTIWNSVPAFLSLLLDYQLRFSPKGFTSIRMVFLSGDWIPLDLPKKLQQLNGHCQMVAMGGATEASIWSNYHLFIELEGHWASIPYGRPLANQRFYVLDENLQDCPDWVPGELYIGGAGVAAGYFKDPRRTANSFLPHPRLPDRIYRTGDWGRYVGEGVIEFLGRQDSQVKIQGYRVELNDVKLNLLQHPWVDDAQVFLLEGEFRELVAFLISKKSDLDIPEIHEFLVKRLPTYMVPGRMTQLKQLHLTVNGKFDRKAMLALL